MKILSFDTTSNKIKRDPNQGNLFNVFQKNTRYNKNILIDFYVVPREHEMRLDKISNFIYGSPNYVEELMILNDIINPYSVKEGQSIWFCSIDNFQNLYVNDEMLTYEEKRKSLINSSQPNRDKKNLSDNQNLPPTVKPNGLQQIKVSKDNKVQIINSFE
jgi:hypothetical protein